jgi:hypothetical protein
MRKSLYPLTIKYEYDIVLLYLYPTIAILRLDRMRDIDNQVYDYSIPLLATGIVSLRCFLPRKLGICLGEENMEFFTLLARPILFLAHASMYCGLSAQPQSTCGLAQY